MYICLHVKYSLFVSGFNDKTDMTELIVTFHHFANTSNNSVKNFVGSEGGQ